MPRKRPRPSISVDTYRDHPLYPKITRAVAAILAESKVVTTVEVMVRIGWLNPKDLENWWHGRVPYLERVIDCNLSKLNRFLAILSYHCHDLNLTASSTVYVKRGEGPRTRLRFSKTNRPWLEKAYARHYVWPGKGPFPLDRLR